MIALQILQKPGTRISLQLESKKLLLHKSLKEQGFQGEVTLSYVYAQLDLPGVWGHTFLDFDANLWIHDEIVEGITRIHGIEGWGVEPRRCLLDPEHRRGSISLPGNVRKNRKA